MAFFFSIIFLCRIVLSKSIFCDSLRAWPSQMLGAQYRAVVGFSHLAAICGHDSPTTAPPATRLLPAALLSSIRRTLSEGIISLRKIHRRRGNVSGESLAPIGIRPGPGLSELSPDMDSKLAGVIPHNGVIKSPSAPPPADQRLLCLRHSCDFISPNDGPG